jgi:hypothetical protein
MAKYRMGLLDATSLQDDESDEDESQLKAIVASRFFLPPSEVQIEGSDGAWIEFAVWFSFEASSPAEIRSETERIIRTCGRNVEVFSVYDGKDNVGLTEEELWNEKL